MILSPFLLPLLLLAGSAKADVSFILGRELKAWGQLTGAKAPFVVEPPKATRFSGSLSVWRRDCSAACVLPAPGTLYVALELDLDLRLEPRQAVSDKRRHVFGSNLEAEVSLFAVCPHGTAGLQEICPGLYFQAQVQLKGEAEAFCGAALDRADAWPFPVLQCAGPGRARPGRRFGVTLHREPLKALMPTAR